MQTFTDFINQRFGFKENFDQNQQKVPSKMEKKVNRLKTIIGFILENPNSDLLVCWDVFAHKECFNSGIMIIKNTNWAYNLFLKVWNSTIPHEHNDQNVIFQEIVKEIYPTSKPELKFSHYCSKLSHPKLKIYPENAFNTNIFNYNKGDFIIHLMGTKTKSRINIMRQINTSLGLDNYKITNCIDVINLFNDANRIEHIEKNCIN